MSGSGGSAAVTSITIDYFWLQDSDYMGSRYGMDWLLPNGQVALAFERLDSLRKFWIPVPLAERGMEAFLLRDAREQAASLAARGVGIRFLPRARVKRGGGVHLVDCDLAISECIAAKTDKVSVDWQLAWLNGKASFIELFRLPLPLP